MLKKFVRYAIVGVVATVVYLGLVIGLVEVAGVDPIVASGGSFVVILIGSYFANHYWTFGSPRQHVHSLPRYVIVSMLGLGLNVVIMYVVVDVFGWWYLVGQLVVILVIPGSNFLLNLRWSFRSDVKVVSVPEK